MRTVRRCRRDETLVEDQLIKLLAKIYIKETGYLRLDLSFAASGSGRRTSAKDPCVSCGDESGKGDGGLAQVGVSVGDCLAFGCAIFCGLTIPCVVKLEYGDRFGRWVALPVALGTCVYKTLVGPASSTDLNTYLWRRFDILQGATEKGRK